MRLSAAAILLVATIPVIVTLGQTAPPSLGADWYYYTYNGGGTVPQQQSTDPNVVNQFSNSASLQASTDPNKDRMTYGATNTAKQLYGPADWGKIRCTDIDTCLGYEDHWLTRRGWDFEGSKCQWCPEGQGLCNNIHHHESPINLQRVNTANQGFTCFDEHRSALFDGSCTWNQLLAKNAFTIERHALQVRYPIAERDLNGFKYYDIDCYDSQGGDYFPRMDFGGGYPTWWLMSHMDVKVPSENTQEGKRYDGEIQMQHFYSVTPEQSQGFNHKVATVSVFLKVYSGVTPNGYIDKLICQWRYEEERNRQQCGLPSVWRSYPGCYYFTRGHRRLRNQANVTTTTTTTKTAAFNATAMQSTTRPTSVFDVLMANDQAYKMLLNEGKEADKEQVLKKIRLSEKDRMKVRPDEEAAAFREHVKNYVPPEQAETEDMNQDERHLADYDNIPWYSYWPLGEVRTEYYHRYRGTQTIPPCLFSLPNNDTEVNHWHVYKDPIRISARQINELHRLLKNRIAPADAPKNACQYDTAAAISPSNSQFVSVARPLQELDRDHWSLFCECSNWVSFFQEDLQWCQRSMYERYYQHPYNFDTVGF